MVLPALMSSSLVVNIFLLLGERNSFVHYIEMVYHIRQRPKVLYIFNSHQLVYKAVSNICKLNHSLYNFIAIKITNARERAPPTDISKDNCRTMDVLISIIAADLLSITRIMASEGTFDALGEDDMMKRAAYAEVPPVY